MKFELEIQRLFQKWISELESDNEWLQASMVRAVLHAFLKWYDEN